VRQKTDPIQVLANLGITRWLHQNPDDNVRSLVNGLAVHLLEDQTIFDLLPVDEDYTDRLRDHFLESGYDVDWYVLLDGSFLEDIEGEKSSIAAQVYNQMDDPSYISHAIGDYVSTWQSRVRKAFSRALEGHYSE